MPIFLLLRFDAPLLSFGGPVVDNRGVTSQHPALSMVTGLLGNALGYRHADDALLQRLQQRVHFAVRRDREGVALTDFQTVDLGQPFLSAPGWTTRGVPEERGGGSAREGTHIRTRQYIADAVFTLAVTIAGDETPTLDDVAAALDAPRRPLFLGRKCCLPSTPLLVGQIEASSAREALVMAESVERARGTPGMDGSVAAWWPETELADGGVSIVTMDQRDWANQIHSGRRVIIEGRLTPTGGRNVG